MSLSMWAIWAVILFAQNFAFTFVSRARNSGSLKKHMVAALMSNGVWFASQFIIIGQIMHLMQGSQGLLPAIGTGLFYTVLTLAGSVTSHYYALRTEKGKGAVGANSKFHQVTVEEWDQLKAHIRVTEHNLQLITRLAAITPENWNNMLGEVRAVEHDIEQLKKEREAA